MNIGGYKPDGNIMTVPEIKEIVTEGVDISDLKDKVNTIQGNVTTLNEAVGELETDLAETILDLNDTKENVSDNATAIADLTTIVERILSEKIGYYVADDEINYRYITCIGYISNASKKIEFLVPDSRINTDLIYTITNFAIVTRFVEGGYGYVRDNNTFVLLGPSPITFINEGEMLISSLDSINVTNTDIGLIFTVNMNEGFYATNDGTQLIRNNTPVAFSILIDLAVS